MQPWLHIGIPVAIGVAAVVSFARNGYDPDHPSFWYILLMVLVFASLVSIIRSRFDRSIAMSTSGRMIRVVGGSIWALILLAGIAVKVWTALR